MDRAELEQRIDDLLREGNYIGAYGRVRDLSDSDGLKSELTGRVANAIAAELASPRDRSVERIAFLRAQLAWVCRDVPGLSYLYREQLRQRPAGFGSDLMKSIQDIASGRGTEVADMVRRNVEDAQESVASGEAADRVQAFLKDAERGLRDGARQVSSFFESIMKRGEAIRLEKTSRNGMGEARSADGTGEGGVKIHIDSEEDKGVSKPEGDGLGKG